MAVPLLCLHPWKRYHLDALDALSDTCLYPTTPLIKGEVFLQPKENSSSLSSSFSNGKPLNLGKIPSVGEISSSLRWDTIYSMLNIPALKA